MEIDTGTVGLVEAATVAAPAALPAAAPPTGQSSAPAYTAPPTTTARSSRSARERPPADNDAAPLASEDPLYPKAVAVMEDLVRRDSSKAIEAYWAVAAEAGIDGAHTEAAALALYKHVMKCT